MSNTVPPVVSRGFWEEDGIKAALELRHMGAVIRAYRTHPFHRRDIPQAQMATWLNISPSRLSRIENGENVHDMKKLSTWSAVLGIPWDLLWFHMIGDPPLGDGRDGSAVNDSDEGRYLASEIARTIAGSIVGADAVTASTPVIGRDDGVNVIHVHVTLTIQPGFTRPDVRTVRTNPETVTC